MTPSGNSDLHMTRPTPIPVDAAPLDSVLCTDELRMRPWRQPDYVKENRALVALANALTESPETVLQTLSNTIMEVTGADSAGVSLLTTEDGGKRFYWPAVAGNIRAVWGGHNAAGARIHAR